MENSLKLEMLERHDNQAAFSRSLKSYLSAVLNELSKSQISNPLVEDILPIELKYDIDNLLCGVNKGAKFLRTYKRKLLSKRLESASIFIEAYEELEYAKIEIKLLDYDIPKEKSAEIFLKIKVIHNVKEFKRELITSFNYDYCLMIKKYCFSSLLKLSRLSKIFNSIEKISEELKFFLIMRRELAKANEQKDKMAESVFEFISNEFTLQNSVIHNPLENSIVNYSINEANLLNSVEFLPSITKQITLEWEWKTDLQETITEHYDRRLLATSFNLMRSIMSHSICVSYYKRVLLKRAFEVINRLFMALQKNNYKAHSFLTQLRQQVAFRKVRYYYKEVVHDRIEPFVAKRNSELIDNCYYFLKQQYKNRKKYEVLYNIFTKEHVKNIKMQVLSIMKELLREKQIYLRIEMRTNSSSLQRAFEILLDTKRERELLKSVFAFSIKQYGVLLSNESYEQSKEFILSTKQYCFGNWREQILNIRAFRKILSDEQSADQFSIYVLLKIGYSKLECKHQELNDKELELQHIKDRCTKEWVFSKIRGKYHLMEKASQAFNPFFSQRLLLLSTFRALRYNYESLNYERKELLQKCFHSIRLKYSSLEFNGAKIAALIKRNNKGTVFKQLREYFSGLKQKSVIIKYRHEKQMYYWLLDFLKENAHNKLIACSFYQHKLAATTFKSFKLFRIKVQLHSLSNEMGRQKKLRYYFSKWSIFILQRRKIYLQQIKLIKLEQKWLNSYIERTIKCHTSNSLILFSNAESISAMLLEAGIQPNKQYKEVVTVEEYKLELKAFIAWRFRLRRLE